MLSTFPYIVAYIKNTCAEQGKHFFALQCLLTVCCCFIISRLTLLLDTVTCMAQEHLERQKIAEEEREAAALAAAQAAANSAAAAAAAAAAGEPVGVPVAAMPIRNANKVFQWHCLNIRLSSSQVVQRE